MIGRLIGWIILLAGLSVLARDVLVWIDTKFWAPITLGQLWFDLAARFADEWDQIAFDPAYDTLPLEHFEPLVREKFARAKLI